MLLGIGIIIAGILQTLWGIHWIKRVSTPRKAGNFLDILINGWESGLGIFISGIVFTIIGIIYIAG